MVTLYRPARIWIARPLARMVGTKRLQPRRATCGRACARSARPPRPEQSEGPSDWPPGGPRRSLRKRGLARGDVGASPVPRVAIGRTTSPDVSTIVAAPGDDPARAARFAEA